MEPWCDADFCSNWNPDTAVIDKTTAKSKIGYLCRMSINMCIKISNGNHPMHHRGGIYSFK